MERSELNQLLARTFPFWDHMSTIDKETFMRSSYHTKFKKGTNIHDGNECTGVILVKSGSLRLYLLSEDGKEITLHRIFAGEVCILSASCVFDTLNFDLTGWDGSTGWEVLAGTAETFADLSEAAKVTLGGQTASWNGAAWVSTDCKLAVDDQENKLVLTAIA